MSQLARISRAALRILPSIFLNEKHVSSKYVGLPTDWLKKKVAAPSFFNPNAITNPRSPFLTSSYSSFCSATAGGTNKGKDQQKEKIRVYVFLPAKGERTEMKLNTYDTIEVVKRSIQELLGFHPNEQALTYRGELLEGPFTVSHYGIQPDRAMFLLLPKQPEFKKFKTSIQELLRVQPNEPELVYRGEILEDNFTLSHYGIKPDSASMFLFLPKDPEFIRFAKVLESLAAPNEEGEHEVEVNQ